MWIVEINILGRRFTHQVHDRRAAFAITPLSVHPRLSALRHLKPRTAA